MFKSHGNVTEYSCHYVVEIMGNSPCQCSNTSEFLYFLKFLLSFPALCNVSDETLQKKQFTLIGKHSAAFFPYPATGTILRYNGVLALKYVFLRKHTLPLIPYTFSVFWINDVVICYYSVIYKLFW